MNIAKAAKVIFGRQFGSGTYALNHSSVQPNGRRQWLHHCHFWFYLFPQHDTDTAEHSFLKCFTSLGFCDIVWALFSSSLPDHFSSSPLRVQNWWPPVLSPSFFCALAAVLFSTLVLLDLSSMTHYGVRINRDICQNHSLIHNALSYRHLQVIYFLKQTLLWVNH